MNARLRTLVLAGLAAAATFVAPAVRADQPNLAVVSEDADQDTVPRNNRIFNRVFLGLAEELNLRGYTVIDETAAGMNITTPDRVRRRDTELIDVARAIRRPPIDAIVIFQIYASTRKSLNSDVVRPEVRISARIIDVQFGRLLGAFEVSSLDLPALPRQCERECLLEQMGDNARIVARDLGVALAEKLDGWKVSRTTAPVAGLGGDPVLTGRPPRVGCETSQAFTITFDGFNNQELTALEDFLSKQPCQEHLRPIIVQGSHAEYWYETSTHAAVLNHDIRVMLDQMGLPGQIQAAGNVFKVNKIGTR